MYVHHCDIIMENKLNKLTIKKHVLPSSRCLLVFLADSKNILSDGLCSRTVII